MKTKMLIGGFVALAGMAGWYANRFRKLERTQYIEASKTRKRYFNMLNELEFDLAMELIDHPDQFRKGMVEIFERNFKDYFDLDVKKF